MTLESRPKPLNRLIRLACIHLHECIELMSAGQIGIYRERSLERGLCQSWIRRRSDAEFVEKPATAAQPRPGCGKARILGQTGPQQIPRPTHRLDRALHSQFLPTEEFFVSLLSHSRFARNRQLEAVAMFRNCLNGLASYHLSQATNQIGQVRLADVHVRPQDLVQLLFRYQVFRPAHQAEQRVEAFRLQRYGHATSLEQPIVGVEFEIRKAVGSTARTLNFL